MPKPKKSVGQKKLEMATKRRRHGSGASDGFGSDAKWLVESLN